MIKKRLVAYLIICFVKIKIMQYYTEDKQQITNKIETGCSSFFPGNTTTSFIAALNFANAIKNELIKVYDSKEVIVGYAVPN